MKGPRGDRLQRQQCHCQILTPNGWGEGGGKRSSPKLLLLIPEGNVPHPENMVRKASVEGWAQRANIWLCWMVFCTVQVCETGLHIHWMEWKCLLWGLLSCIRLGITRPRIEVSRGLFLWQQICTSRRANTAQSPRWATAVLPSHCPVVYFQNDLRGTSETRAEVINCF